MDLVLLAGRLLLAGIFVLAAGSKLADRAGSRRAIEDFGVPVMFATPLGTLLPLAELAVAACLLPTATAWWGALGAVLLLLLFSAGIGVNLVRGRRPQCRCFGQLHSAPAGWSTLVRNVVLAAVAGFVLWQGRDGLGPSTVSWPSGFSVPQTVSLIGWASALTLVVAQWWSILRLLSRNRRLLARLEAVEGTLGASASGLALSRDGVQPVVGLPVGAMAPDFRLPDLHSDMLTLDALLRAPGKPLVLIFTDPRCDPCAALLPEIGGWQREHAAELTISLISRGSPEENRTKSAAHGLSRVLLQSDWEVFNAYRVEGTPSAVLVLPDGTIGGPLAAGATAIRALVAQAAGAQVHASQRTEAAPAANGTRPGGRMPPPVPAGSKIGEPAPPFELPDLGGNSINLSTFEGAKTLLLFWNPKCGFCAQMLNIVKAWEADLPAGAPQPLVVSSGTVEANRSMGLRSPVVLDQVFAVARAFGVYGTPSAVLIDAQGHVASEVAVGAPAVLALAEVYRTNPNIHNRYREEENGAWRD